MKNIFILLISILLFFNSLVQAQNDEINILQIKAESYEQQAKYNLAISTYLRILSKTSVKAPLFAKLGSLYNLTDNRIKAKEFYYKAIVVDTNLLLPHLELANIYILEKNYKLVAQHYIRYIQDKNANQTDSLTCLNYLFLAKKYSFVIDLFNKLKFNSSIQENPDINRMMGYTYSEKKSPNYPLAYLHFNIFFNSSHSSQMNDNDLLKMYNVCTHINTSDAHKRGISCLEELSKLDSTQAYYDELAKCYLDWNHDYDKAAQYFEKTVDFLKKSKKMVNNSIYLNIGKCYYFSYVYNSKDEAKITKAFNIFSDLIKDNRDYPYGYLWLARVQKVYFSNEPKILIKSNYSKFLAIVNTVTTSPKNLEEARSYINTMNK